MSVRGGSDSATLRAILEDVDFLRRFYGGGGGGQMEQEEGGGVQETGGGRALGSQFLRMSRNHGIRM